MGLIYEQKNENIGKVLNFSLPLSGIMKYSTNRFIPFITRRTTVRRGFTLIEILILLALTSLLMSILLPALAFGRKQARALECSSNLHQLGQLHSIEKGMMNGNWGTSAYDLDSDGSNHTTGDGNGKGSGNFGNEDDPTKAKDFTGGGFNNGTGTPYDELLEDQAANPPSTWNLVCPVGLDAGVNSYGITDQAIEQSFDLLSGSTDMIFGCCDYKVIVSIQSFALRHLKRANIFFGDNHVKPIGLNGFTQVFISQFRR